MAADVGTHAPDFTLPNQDRQPVTLSAELVKSPVVLAFFPAAFSSVCTKELCTFKEAGGPLNALSRAKVLGISVDTPFALKAFSEAQKLNFPLLSDFNKNTIRAYDVVNPEMVGLQNIAKRAVVLISQDGMVRYKEVLDDARNEPSYEALNAAIAKL
jgi:peroxiredoxin